MQKAKVKTLAVKQILTEKELKQALELYDTAENHRFAERCASEIIGPVLDRIDHESGQENDPIYLAYCIEYAIMKSRNKMHS